MPNISYHPAPGLGDLLPGFFVVPQNPIEAASPSGPMVAGLSAAFGYETVRIPRAADILANGLHRQGNPLLYQLNRGLNDLTPGRFVVPQNPITDAMMGMGDLTPGRFVVPQNPITAGMGCASCNGGSYGNGISSGLQGLGDSVSDSIGTWAMAASPVSFLGNAAFYGLLIGAAGFFLMKGHHKLL